MIKVTICFFIIVTLFGCNATVKGPSQSQIINQNINKMIANKNCFNAFDYAFDKLDGYRFYYWYGRIEHECRGNTEKAIAIWSALATMGNKSAKKSLELVGAPVPRTNPPPLPPISVPQI